MIFTKISLRLGDSSADKVLMVSAQGTEFRHSVGIWKAQQHTSALAPLGRWKQHWCIQSSKWVPGSVRVPVSESRMESERDRLFRSTSCLHMQWHMCTHPWTCTHIPHNLCQRKLQCPITFVDKFILQTKNHNYNFQSSSFLILLKPYLWVFDKAKEKIPFPQSNFLFRKMQNMCHSWHSTACKKGPETGDSVQLKHTLKCYF